MWCERCPDRNDWARPGTDEHPYKAWGILCGQCLMDLDIEAGMLADQAQENLRREVEARDRYYRRRPFKRGGHAA